MWLSCTRHGDNIKGIRTRWFHLLMIDERSALQSFQLILLYFNDLHVFRSVLWIWKCTSACQEYVNTSTNQQIASTQPMARLTTSVKLMPHGTLLLGFRDLDCFLGDSYPTKTNTQTHTQVNTIINISTTQSKLMHSPYQDRDSSQHNDTHTSMHPHQHVNQVINTFTKLQIRPLHFATPLLMMMSMYADGCIVCL